MQNQTINPQMFQNMMMMMSKMQQPIIFNPKTLDIRFKRSIMNKTLYQSTYGLFKDIPLFKTMQYSYNNFNPNLPDNICDVEVVHEHSLDVAEQHAEKGLQISRTNGLNPVILNIVGKDFSGSNIESFENIKDEILFMRTNISRALITPSSYPLKETTCTYDGMITVIRPKIISHPDQFLPYQGIFRVGVITTSPIKVEKLLKGNKMCSTDFVKTHTTIQAIFQLAIAKNHKVLILSPFGHEEENNPMEDIVKIYNYCILKFGHLFKKIIIAIPPYYSVDIVNFYKSNIIVPSIIVNEVDQKYDNLTIKNKLQSTNDEEQNQEQEQLQMLEILKSLKKR